MKKVLIILLAIVGVLAVLSMLAIAAIGVLSLLARERVPSSMILEADFERPVLEVVPEDPFARLMFENMVQIRDVVEALDQAAGDDRVKAFVAHVGASPMGLAHIQEIRDAVIRFRASGKPAIVFAETFGEFGPGNGSYYLASAFDEIYLQPSGDLGLTGLLYETPFVRGMLDKLQVTPRMDQRYEYKNAMNLFTERAFTEPHRRSMQTLMDSQFSQMVRGIASDRGLPEDRVRELFDDGPYLASEAVDVGLVDALAYRDGMLDALEERVGESDRLELPDYLERAGRPNRRGTTIALIHGYGQVVRGRSSYSPLSGTVVMGSDTVSSAFRDAVDDDRVKAIIFRVDSPGGSYVASDTIWRETVRAREAGKPVIVTMGNVAASGGYFVSMHADRIVAQPGTITASIGVLAGKLLTRRLWERFGIAWDDVQSSENATMWTGTHDFSEEEWERFQAWLDRIYGDFTGKVADGRGLESEAVLEAARGRVWTGEDAKRLGLVDELGGFDAALRLAREAAGLEPDAGVRLKIFPRPRTVLEVLLEEGPTTEGAAWTAIARELRELQPYVRSLSRLALETMPPPLYTPGLPAER